MGFFSVKQPMRVLILYVGREGGLTGEQYGFVIQAILDIAACNLTMSTTPHYRILSPLLCEIQRAEPLPRRHNSHTDFQSLLNPTHTVCHILLAHFVAILVFFAPTRSNEWPSRTIGSPNRGMFFRPDGMRKNMPHTRSRHILILNFAPSTLSYCQRQH
jgi:hypothetical protein